MRYFLAFLVPPAAIFLCGRPIHGIINLVIWLISIPLLFFGVGFLVWLIAAVHALSICRVRSMDRRLDRVVKAIESRQSSSAPAASSK